MIASSTDVISPGTSPTAVHSPPSGAAYTQPKKPASERHSSSGSAGSNNGLSTVASHTSLSSKGMWPMSASVATNSYQDHYGPNGAMTQGSAQMRSPGSGAMSMNAAPFVPSNVSFNTASKHTANSGGYGYAGEPWPSTTNGKSNDILCPILLIRNLGQGITKGDVRAMFLCAEGFREAELVPDPAPQDGLGHYCAVAHFDTAEHADRVRAKVDGQPNAVDGTRMSVELLESNRSRIALVPRRSNDSTGSQPPQSSRSSNSSSHSHTSPFGASAHHPGAFQPFGSFSPTSNSHGSNEFGSMDMNHSFKEMISPTTSYPGQAQDMPWRSGKSMIKDDTVDDDETGELLRDPIAYMQNGHSGQPSVDTQTALSRFSTLSLATNSMTSPTNSSSLTSPGSGLPYQTPSSTTSPTWTARGPTSSFSFGSQQNTKPQVFQQGSLSQQLQQASAGQQGQQQAQPQVQQSQQGQQGQQSRTAYPTANPSDQNPPCNTLYVGNLPSNVSEKELKDLFQKQRGYKRQVFRVKGNGPMCFVEFENITFATKALNDLYGQVLSNSTRGGIRLSFSKNPLGVRSATQSRMGPSISPQSSSQALPQTANGASNGLSGSQQQYLAACRPPPGLEMPPGFSSEGVQSLSNAAFVSSPAMPATMASPISIHAPGMSGAHAHTSLDGLTRHPAQFVGR